MCGEVVMDQKMTYRGAGVDVDAGNQAVKLMRKYVESTPTKGVVGGIGGFGGLFELDIKKYERPLLISGTDGVGTKLKLAFMMDKHDTIGVDCVAMCINDILTYGAEPLFFLDYIAIGRLIPQKIALIVKGVAEGCKMANCGLIGGETAEMPDMYDKDEYDIAGFAVGVVDKGRLIDGAKIKPKDIVIGLASTGLHSNGYSLARKVFFEKCGYSVDTHLDELGKTIGDELLIPTRIYVEAIHSILKSDVEVHGMAHITGGGLTENLPRLLPEGLKIMIEAGSWEVPQIFYLLQRLGGIDDSEMYRTFNMGVGYVVITPEESADRVIKIANNCGILGWVIGRVERGRGGVSYCPR
jgi:phosphoribosylformylglycinamidine cyclo-ligase